MADSKISALSDGTAPAGTDKFVVARSGANNYLTWTEMLAASPGAEIGYDQITTGVTVASTTETSGTAIITCASHTFDGGAVMVEFFTPNIVPPLSGNSGFLIANLFESTTDNGRIVQVQTNTTVTDNWPVTGRLRFTPSAGAHSFVVTAWKLNGSGTVKVDAGAGGTGTMMPCFVRFTKV